MAVSHVIYEVSTGIGTVTLNRPESRNAMNRALLEDLCATLRDASADPDVNAVVITGAGPAFCAGADLKEIPGSGPVEVRERVDRTAALYEAIRQMPQPLIAAVNGPAVAGGCGVAMACDFVISADTAMFGYPEVPLGLVPATVTVSLSRLVGSRAALDLLLTGRSLSPEEALTLGMINEIVPADNVMFRARALASVLAGFDRDVVQMTKKLFLRVAETTTEFGLEQARMTNLIARQLESAVEGAQAFGRSREG